MSTTNCGRSSGFTLIELLVALSLSLLIAMAVSGMWLALQRSQVEAADRLSALIRTRVVAGRFEKDLRHATIAECGTGVTSPVLRAGDREVVVLSAARGAGPELVEWELAGGNLMRRHGPWTGVIPPRSQHQAFTSSKTMLEGVSEATGFVYNLGGDPRSQVDDASLGLVTRISMEGQVPSHKVPLNWSAEVGR